MDTTALSRTELLQVADAVAREKSIERDEVLEAMEQAIGKAGRAKYGHEHDIRAEIDRKTGEIRLRRMRVNDCARTVISSLPVASNSGVSGSPLLTLLAICAMRVTGSMTMRRNITFRAMMIARNTPTRVAMKVINARCACAIGTSIGTDTTCAPTTSLSCQPNPLAVP